MGVAGMVLGIIAVGWAMIPVLGGIIAFPFIAVGLTLSAVAFDRARRRAEAKEIAGIVTNGVALAFAILWLTLVVAAASKADITIENSALTWSLLQLV